MLSPAPIRTKILAARDPNLRPATAGRPGQEGSTLLLALLILAALGIVAASVAVVSMGDRNLSKYERDSVQALAAAESGVAFAKRAIVDQTATIQDYDSDGRLDFVMADSLDWGATYSVIAEASDILGPGVAAYHSNGFSVLSEGRFRGAVRRVKVELVHDSFLKFARFISQQGLSFDCGDVMAGEVYAGNNITLTCGCSPGQEAQFLEKVYTAGSIPQASCGVFELGYEEGVDEINMMDSIDWDQIRDKARGIGTNSSCEGQGSIGIYMDLPSLDPLGLGTQPGINQNTIVLTLLDFQNTVLVPGDTVVTYDGNLVMNTVTGQAMRLQDFNGIILFEGDSRVKGVLDGVSAFRLSVFATDHAYIVGDIICGHTGFDAVTRLPNNSGAPITSALVAENYVAMHDDCPKILRVDAAIFSRTSNLRALGGPGQHPDGGPGPLDLDIDGITGETPLNNDPRPGMGWDELNITSQHWVLNLTGPIITYSVGDLFPWAAGPHLGPNPGPTRRYNYDISYMEFPPACFPIPINVWVDVSWTEIFDAQSPLASHLPH